MTSRYSAANRSAPPGAPLAPLPARLGFGATLALAMGIGPLALYALSALSPFVIGDLGLTRTQFGSLATTSFAVAAVSSGLGGRAIDRVDGRRALYLLFTTSAIALAAVAAAPTYVWLLLAVAISGASQSLSNPVTNHLIAANVVPGRRGLLMGTKQSGVQMSQFVAGAALPPVALTLGWRGAAVVAVVVALLGLLLVPATVPARQLDVHAPQAGGDIPAQKLPGSVWWLTSYAFLIGAALQATNVYMPLYAYESVGLSAAVAGTTTGVMGAIGLASRIGWGQLAERVGDPQRPLTALALGAAGGVVALAAAGPGTEALVWVGAAVHGATALAANVVVMLGVIQAAPARHVGRATGLLAVGLYLGFAAGPLAFGALADRTGGYRPGWLVLVCVYLAATLLIRAWVRLRPAAPSTSTLER